LDERAIAEAITKLEVAAGRIAKLLPLARRPFIIEFAGTPKSGKSTSVEAIRHFFSRHGFRVHVLTERAAVCPIPMKGHLFFNTWCASSMLAELLENVEAETDIIIVDRGLFDALVWLTQQEKRGELTNEEARIIEKFLTLDRWRTLIDLAVVMSVSAEEALARETAQRITAKGGSIMNQEVLKALTDSVDDALKRYGSQFRDPLVHQTSGEDVRPSNIRLAEGILGRLETFLNPEILVVPREQVEALVPDGGSFGQDAVQRALHVIASEGRYMLRADAESSAEVVQVISCGILKNEGKVFVFQRKEADPKYQLHGKAVVWQGSHVTHRSDNTLADLQNSLGERLSRELFLSRAFPMSPIGLCWDPEDPGSSAHLGVMFEVEINNIHTVTDLKKKEFRKRRGHGLSGQFLAQEDLVKDQDKLSLESWSRAVLGNRGAK
jgi:predicted NUDIX family phosphoesterase